MKILLKIILLIFIFDLIFAEDCSNFNSENVCQVGTQTEYPNEWNNRKWQTPSREDPLWKESFQDLNLFTGYVQIRYNNNEKTEATLNFITMANTEKIKEDFYIKYYFGNKISKDGKFIFKKGDDIDEINGK